MVNRGFKVFSDHYGRKVQLHEKSDPFRITRLTPEETKALIKDLQKAIWSINAFEKRREKALQRMKENKVMIDDRESN